MPAKFYAANNEAIQQQYQEEQEQSQRDSTWLKLPEGPSRLRICPPWSEAGLPCQKITTFNNVTDGDKKTSILSYQYIFESPSVMKYLGTQQLISRADYDAWSKHGDPFLVVAKRAKEVLTEGEYKKAKDLWPRTSFVWNIINRKDPSNPKVFKWSSSKKFYEAVMLQAGFCPNLFDPEQGFDFMITATGEGGTLNRRYGPPMFIPQPTALGMKDDDNLYNLDKELAQSVRPFAEYVQLLISNKAQLLQRLGIDPAQWNK